MQGKRRAAFRAIVLTIAAISALPAFAETPQIYHCVYNIIRPGKPGFTMEGNIVLSDVANSPAAAAETYLTLEPPEVSGIDITARVLITHWSDNGGYYYNPMSLHRRGDTAKPLAGALLEGQGGMTKFHDSTGNYSLQCQLR